MAVSIVVESNLPEVATRLERIAAAASVEAQKGRLDLAVKARALIVPIIAEKTPRRTGKLAESTMGEIVSGGDVVLFRQPAESLPNQDGTGGGQHYVQWVVQGRGDVYPVNKKALTGPGFGPVKHAGPVAPNPYPHAAMQAAAAPLDALLMEEGHGIMATLMTVL